MVIEVKKIDQSNIKSVNQVDGNFWVDSRLQLSAVDGKISYTIVPIPGYPKPYIYDDIDPTAYVTNPDKTIYLARIGDQLAGQITLRKNWNLFAYVEDFVVNPSFRRKGVGRTLMSKAGEWSKSMRFQGIMLETQDINVAACRFYERCGFELAGFDRNLYKATDPDKDEIALYWYLIF
jgi:streptothricin acetyltransferase